MTVREVLNSATDKNGNVTVYKTFMTEYMNPYTFKSAIEAEQWIKNDIYNNIQMHMAPNVEIKVNVVGALQFDVTPRVNSCVDGKGGPLNYVNDREDTKR